MMYLMLSAAASVFLYDILFILSKFGSAVLISLKDDMDDLHQFFFETYDLYTQ